MTHNIAHGLFVTGQARKIKGNILMLVRVSLSVYYRFFFICLIKSMKIRKKSQSHFPFHYFLADQKGQRLCDKVSCDVKSRTCSQEIKRTGNLLSWAARKPEKTAVIFLSKFPV